MGVLAQANGSPDRRLGVPLAQRQGRPSASRPGDQALREAGAFRREEARWETLRANARQPGTMIDRVHRELMDDDIARIASTYHAWRGEKQAGKYADVPGFAKAAKLDQAIAANLARLGHGQ